MNSKKAKILRRYVNERFKYMAKKFIGIDESGDHIESFHKITRPYCKYIGIKNKDGFVINKDGNMKRGKQVGTIVLDPDCKRAVYQTLKKFIQEEKVQ